MIQIVTGENRHLYRHALVEMHHQRRRLFVEEMGWPLETMAGLELDAFDADDAVYLILADHPRAPVRASARLLPTDRPHLLCDVFGALCDDGVPRGANIWEASRFCPAPETPKGEARRVLLGKIIAGIIETGLLFGVESVTYVAGAALTPLARSAGWTTTALGSAKREGRDRLTAFLSDIDVLGLKRVRAQYGIEGPITRFMSGAAKLAA